MENSNKEKTKKQRRVLIIDDNKELRDSITSIFQLEKVEIKIVNDYEEAKEEFGKRNYTEILTDGLHGGWKKVEKMAGETPVKVMSTDNSIKKIVEQRGRVFVDKFDPNFIDLVTKE